VKAAEAESEAFLSGVILAAGASTRMGKPKQLLPLGERPLLQHVLDQALASRLDEVILVLGHRAEEIQKAMRIPEGSPVRVRINSDPDLGQSESLRLGLRAADPRAAAAAVLLGDQPGVGSNLIDRMASAFLASDRPLVRPVYSGAGGAAVPGHPVLLARRVWRELETLRGDQGARALVAARPEWLLAVPMEGEAPNDIDSPADYRRALAAEGAGP
jgi:molybdenum cofactor cytidylyltransferase